MAFLARNGLVDDHLGSSKRLEALSLHAYSKAMIFLAISSQHTEAIITLTTCTVQHSTEISLPIPSDRIHRRIFKPFTNCVFLSLVDYCEHVPKVGESRCLS